jgi:exodeoxyribonuclease (lambda-induced)
MRIACSTQRDASWFSAKLGKVGASGVANVMDFLKSGKSSVKRDDYVLELAWQLFTGCTTEHYVSKPMDLGTEYEPEARRAYFLRTGNDVKQTGFVLHPTLDYFGASPDGLLGKDGILEIKVPLPSTHRRYIRDGVVPEQYVYQIQAQMLCCERSWADFVSYCPPSLYEEMTPRTCLFIRRMEADPKLHRQIEEAVTTFMAEVVQLVRKLDANCPELPKEPETADEFAGLGAGLDDKDLDQIWKEPK